MTSLRSDDKTGPLFHVLPTASPTEVSFRVGFSMSIFQPNWLPELYQAYGACPFPTKPRSEQGTPQFKTYIYTDCQIGDGYIWLYFALDKTPAEMKTPVRVKQDTKQWRWPDVLYGLQFVQDDEFPLVSQFPLMPDKNTETTGGSGTVYAQRVYPRYSLKPAALALSRVKEEIFTSARPFTANMMSHAQPTEGNVSWDFNGSQGSFTCLHPRIVIPARGKSYVVVVNAVTSGSAAPNIPERVFPATNFEDWEPFVLYDDVVFENGVFTRRRGTIYPPEGNEPSTL